MSSITADMLGDPVLWLVVDIVLFILLINMPLGRLRADSPRYSWRNFSCILAPLPMIVAVRIMAGLSIIFAPLFLLVAIAGQRLGLWIARSSH